MSATILSLLAHHGAAILLAVTFLASVAAPLPASFALLAAGALSASGDLSLPGVAAAALAGAAAGDMVAYGAGRWGGSGLWDRMARQPKMGRMLDEARALLHRHAAGAVLLSRWPFSPLGPYVSAISGATRLPAARFAALAVLGNAVWIGLYTGLGHVFAARIKDVGHVMTLVAMGAALAVVTVLLVRLRRIHAGSAP